MEKPSGPEGARFRVSFAAKQLDMIVINDALEPGAGFDVDTNAVTILDIRGVQTAVSIRQKSEVAEAILDAIEAYRG